MQQALAPLLQLVACPCLLGLYLLPPVVTLLLIWGRGISGRPRTIVLRNKEWAALLHAATRTLMLLLLCLTARDTGIGYLVMPIIVFPWFISSGVRSLFAAVGLQWLVWSDYGDSAWVPTLLIWFAIDYLLTIWVLKFIARLEAKRFAAAPEEGSPSSLVARPYPLDSERVALSPPLNNVYGSQPGRVARLHGVNLTWTSLAQNRFWIACCVVVTVLAFTADTKRREEWRRESVYGISSGKPPLTEGVYPVPTEYREPLRRMKCEDDFCADDPKYHNIIIVTATKFPPVSRVRTVRDAVIVASGLHPSKIGLGEGAGFTVFVPEYMAKENYDIRVYNAKGVWNFSTYSEPFQTASKADGMVRKNYVFPDFKQSEIVRVEIFFR